MKSKLVIAGTLFVLMFSVQAMAYSPAIIGGVRDGTAIGLLLESTPSDNLAIRFGFETSSANSPGIFFLGGKWFMSDMDNRFPLYLSGGIVGYANGTMIEVGPYVSAIFERFLNITPLFLEIGIDVVKSGKLQAQAGFHF